MSKDIKSVESSRQIKNSTDEPTDGQRADSSGLKLEIRDEIRGVPGAVTSSGETPTAPISPRS